jgi:pyridoxal phosphate enzyme (YggS family)
MPIPGLAERLVEIRANIRGAVARGGHGQEVQIVAVTKTHGPEAVVAAWDAGIRAVGENKVQEALAKMPEARVPVEWHLIGHLQRNKVKHVASFALVHSVDSPRLAEAIHDESQRLGRAVPVLIQVNVSGEASKGGYDPTSLPGESAKLRSLDGLAIRGVMTMAPWEASEEVLRQTFRGARQMREVLRDAGLPAAELSMGMSGDYEVAVEEGATMVRLGTILFGARGT